MVDAFLPFGEDFQLDQYGGIQSAVGWDETQQNISRALYTNPSGVDIAGRYLGADYKFNPNYGLGLRRVVGALDSLELQTTLAQKCKQAVLSNSAVLQVPAPIVQFIREEHALSIFITVFLANQQPGIIALEYS